MLQSKKTISLTVILIAGLLFLGTPLLAQNSMENCGMHSLDKSNLSEEQLNKIESIEEQFEKDIIPLRQELNLLKTKAYNYTLNENVDVEKIKDFKKEIRETEGKIEDKRLDLAAEINTILPEDQQDDFSGYFSQCGNKGTMMSGHNMMKGKGMMHRNNMMDGSGMMKMCMQMMDKMHGDSGMMGDKMMNHGMMDSDSSNSLMNGNMMKKDSSKTMKQSEHEQHHK